MIKNFKTQSRKEDLKFLTVVLLLFSFGTLFSVSPTFVISASPSVKKRHAKSLGVINRRRESAEFLRWIM